MRSALLTYARALGIVALGACGCALLPDTPTTVKTLINAHAYYEDVYQSKCVTQVGPPACTAIALELRAWKADTIKATAELKGGGKIPLRLAQLKAHQKFVAKGLK